MSWLSRWQHYENCMAAFAAALIGTKMNTDFGIFFLICIIILALLIIGCLIRAIKGPKIADRIMAANMIGTLAMAIMLLLAVYLNASYIADVCLVYAVISFLAVVVITKIYVGLYREEKAKKETGEQPGKEREEDSVEEAAGE